MKRALSVLAFLIGITSTAVAQPPDVNLSTIPQNIGLSPTGTLPYTVTIIGVTGQPMQNASIEIRFNAPGDTLTCWCSDVPDPGPFPAVHSFFASTNTQGEAVFNIRGGGCIQLGLLSIPGSDKFAAQVYINGFYASECGTVSPDAVDNAGCLPTSSSSLWDPAGMCSTGLADAVQHTTPLATSSYSWCTDINGDRVCSVSDAVILTPFMASAASCIGNAGSIP